MITAQFNTPDKPIILVAGGAGFVGSFLCETLLLQGCQVICIDNLSTGKKENLTKCLSNPNFSFINADLNNSLPAEISFASFIFDLAGTEKGTENLLEFAQKTGAKILIVTLQPKEIFHRPNLNYRLVRLFDVYGPRMRLDADHQLVLLIKTAVTGQELKIFGDGNQKFYPTFVSDIVYGLTKLMFGIGTESEIINLVPPQGITSLSFALTLKKHSQKEIKIDYLPAYQDKDFQLAEKIIKEEKKFNWKTKVSLDDGIKQTLDYFQGPKDKPIITTPTDSLSKKDSSKVSFHWPIFFPILFLILGLILLPIVSLLADAFWGTKSLVRARDEILTGEFSSGSKNARASQEFLRRAAIKTSQFRPLFRLFGQSEIVEGTEKLFYLGKETAGGLVRLCLIGENISSLSSVIFQNQNLTEETQISFIFKKLTEIKSDLDQGFSHFSSAEAELKKYKSIYRVAKIFGFVDKVKKMQELLPQVRNLITQAKKGIEVVPALIGLEKKQTYLVLLQNSAELRPTGGFIGSFAILTFEKGKLLDIEIQDVYWADGQLKGHVEPPAELKKYLGEANWYLRDSNWSPDFPTSAKRAIWFLEKETGRSVEGVLGVDLFLIQRVLRAVGDIEMPDFKEKINATNVFERAEYYSEIGFFPGSTQKQDFLGSLTRSLFEQLKENNKKIWVGVAQGIYQSLLSKDLMIYLNDVQAMEMINELNWDGQIREVNCQVGNGGCLFDYLMIVETNVGINKANFFVDRTLNHQIEISPEGAIRENLQINYWNNSPGEISPAGKYRNYLRILLPLNSELEKVLIDGQPVGRDKIDKETILSKTAFGFIVEVPVKESRTVKISYVLPERIPLTEKSQYLFMWQKQAGTKEEKVNLKLFTPSGVVILSAKPEAVADDQAYLFNLRFNQDIIIETLLVK